jgi:hypothetical protein
MADSGTRTLNSIFDEQAEQTNLLQQILAKVSGATPPPPPPVVTPIEWDPLLTELGLTVEVRNGEFGLVAAWLTVNGSWDSVPDFARKWQMNTLGGDHMFFGRSEDVGGAPLSGTTFAMVWPSGGDTRVTDNTGWANNVLAGQNWDPKNGPGPYTGFMFGGDKLIGAGMPHNWHWSFFGVWRRRAAVRDMDLAEWGKHRG